MSHEPEALWTLSRMADLDLRAGGIHGIKAEGLVVGLPLPYQPLHIGGVLSTQCTLLQPSITDVHRRARMDMHTGKHEVWCIHRHPLLLDTSKHSDT